MQTIHTAVNGQACAIEGASSKTLLDALRDNVGLTGSKLGCGEGECGACTVWINGQAAMACLVPAAQAHGASITTIEGLASAERRAQSAEQLQPSDLSPQPSALHPLQRAFIEHGAVQCGYCIPGMLMAGAALLAEHPRPTREQAQQAISGNICRCTGYRKILDAIAAASQ
ncbi:MAG: (2Fe-2S)-binding protein [Chloroflexales bacterium]|nr:(2Fe-2S)-binding protein [Chloroflexales bacterium]